MWPFGSNERDERQQRIAELQEKLINAKVKALQARREFLYGSYDAAQTTDRNIGHWNNADARSADAANSRQVRERLRQRARYEVANNSYARGIVLTLANYTVGTGPRLQVLEESDKKASEVEASFEAWSEEVRLGEKLRTMRMARAQDGEAFARIRDNDTLRHPVQVDLQLIEADQVATPGVALDQEVDGIVLDDYGQPKTYHVLKHHPGGSKNFAALSKRDKHDIDARSMIHWFRSDRPGQHRGVPDITPALPLFAQLRRYTLAVIEAAETAADLAGIIESNAPPPDGTDGQVEPLDLVEIERGMLMTMPEGRKVNQMRAEQPATTYREFKREILTEIARCLNMPYNIAAADSSDYNYASGRLDHQTYFKSIRVDQTSMGRCILDRILWHWFAEWDGQETPEVPKHKWFWDGQEHVDPSKEAKAQEKRLANDTTTLADEYAKQGQDWETKLRQRAREKKLQRELGLSDAEAAPAAEARIEDMIEDAVEDSVREATVEV